MKIFSLKGDLTLENLNQTHHIGFVTDDHHKGYLVYIGSDRTSTDSSLWSPQIAAVYAHGNKTVCNISSGSESENRSSTVQEALDFRNRDVADSVTAVFVFSTRKELYRWLSED